MRFKKSISLLLAILFVLNVLSVPVIAATHAMSEGGSGGPARPTKTIQPKFVRVGDKGTVGNAIKLSRQWKRSSSVVLVAEKDWNSAVLAGPLAGALGAPILVTGGSGLDARVSARIAQLKARKAFLIGNQKVLSGQIQTSVKARKIKVVRIGGKNPYAASRLVALKIKSLLKETPEVVAVSNGDYTGAASISAYSAFTGAPIFIINKKGVSQEIRRAIRELQPNSTLIVGGNKLISPKTAKNFPGPQRLTGKNEFDASAKIADFGVQRGMSLKNTVLTAKGFQDSLIAGPWAAKRRSPIMLTHAYSLPQATKGFITKRSASFRQFRVLGDEADIAPKVVRTAVDAATTVLYDDMIYPDKAASGINVLAITSDTIDFQGSESKLKTIKAGSIVIGKPSDMAPEGYFRKVTGVQKTGDILRAATTNGALTDVFASGGFHESMGLGDSSKAPIAPAGLAAKSLAEKTWEFNPGYTWETGDTAKKKGDYASVSIKLQYKVVASISWYRPHWWSAPNWVRATATQTKVLTIEGDAYWKKTHEYTKTIVPETTFFVVPLVEPFLYLNFEVQIDFKVKIDGKFNAKAGYRWSKTDTLGVLYEKGSGWKTIKTFEPDTSEWTQPPKVYAEGNIRAEFDIWIKAKVSDSVGVKFALVPYGSMKAEGAYVYPEAPKFKFTVAVGLDGIIAGEVDVFGLVKKDFGETPFSIIGPKTLWELIIGGEPAPGVESPPLAWLNAQPKNAAVRLSWVNPSWPYLYFSKTRILRSTAGYADSPNPTSAQKQIYEGRDETFSDTGDTGLTNGTTYYYTAFVQDTTGKWSAAKQSKAKPNNPYPGGSPWPMFGYDMQHTRRSSQMGPTWQPGWTLYGYPFLTSDDIFSSPAVLADGTIYVGSFDGTLYSLDNFMMPNWTFKTAGMIYSSPAVGADGTIYVGSDDKKLYAIGPDGTLKWFFTTGGWLWSSPVIDFDGTIYVGSNDKKLYAFNPEGTLKWSYLTGGAVKSSPAIGPDGTIYVGSMDKKLYAINPDGTLKWTYATGGGIFDGVFSSPAVGPDGTIYVGSEDNKLYAINPDGTLKWSYAAGDPGVSSSPAIGADGTIYVGGFDKKLYAINPDGALKWSVATGGVIWSSPAVDAGGTIYVGSGDKKLYAINPDGTLKWSYTTLDAIYSSPAIGPGNQVYVGSNDGRLYRVTYGDIVE